MQGFILFVVINLCLRDNGDCDQECHYDESTKMSECKCLMGYALSDKRCGGKLAKQFCLGFASLKYSIS